MSELQIMFRFSKLDWLIFILATIFLITAISITFGYELDNRIENKDIGKYLEQWVVGQFSNYDYLDDEYGRIEGEVWKKLLSVEISDFTVGDMKYPNTYTIKLIYWWKQKIYYLKTTEECIRNQSAVVRITKNEKGDYEIRTENFWPNVSVCQTPVIKKREIRI